MPLDSTGYLSPTSYGERDILFHRPTATEQEQANSEQSVRARRAVDEDGEVLRKAAEILERTGWWGGERICEGLDSHCLLRAVGAAKGDADHGYTTHDARRLGFCSLQDAFDWNDAPGRTAAEVIARLRSAAEQRA